MIGKVLKGTYKVLDEVGQGGIATVYLARNLQTGETVAVKVIHPHIAASEKSFLSRFQREAEILRSLASRHIPRYYDSGVEDGLNFIVIEYIQGISVADVIKQRERLEIDVALEIVRQTAEGLQCTFEQGIVHRDIKPANLMITVENVVKIMDFGIARNIDAAGLTQTGFLGTPNYISPEQADGKETDIRSDLYSLGASLFEMLSGRILFDGNSPISVAIKHISAPVPPITMYRKDVPPEVEALLQRCLAKNQADRFQTPNELVVAIDTIIGPSDAVAGHAAPAPPWFAAEQGAAQQPVTDFAMTASTMEDGVRAGKIIPCPRCGTSVPAIAVFCPTCGTSVKDIARAASPAPVASAPAQAAPVVPPLAVKRQSGRGVLLLGAAAVLVLIVISGGVVAWRAVGHGGSTTPVAGLGLTPGATAPGGGTAVVSGQPTPGGLSPRELIVEGDDLTMRSRYDDAVDRYKKAIELDSVNVPAHIQWGRTLIWAGNPTEAIAKLEKATKLATTNADRARAYAQLARAYDWTYRFKDAITAAQTAIQADANNAEAHAFLAEAQLDCLDSGDCPSGVDLDMAELEARTAIKLDDKGAEGYTVLAAIERKKGRFDASITDGRKAVDLQPTVSLRHYNLATLYLENGNYDMAVQSFRRSIDLYNKFASAFFGLGQAYKAQNKCQEAIPFFEEALRVDPKFTSALHALEECRRQVK